MGLPLDELEVIPLNGVNILATTLNVELIGGRWLSDHDSCFINDLPLIVTWVLSSVNLVK
jgi:hypothetical protein